MEFLDARALPKDRGHEEGQRQFAFVRKYLRNCLYSHGIVFYSMKSVTGNERESVPEVRSQLVSGLRIRDGLPEDAEELFALIRTAFSERELQYSIYQAPESVAYLRVQLGKEIFRIAELEGAVVGYFQSQNTGTTLYTKYLAAIHKRGGGIVAPALIRDMIQMGRRLGLSSVEFDAMAGNQALISLYCRYGARPMSSSYVYKVDLSQVPKMPGLIVSIDELAESLREEKRQGLSKVNVCWGSTQIVIGLLAGHTCKVLDGGGLSLVEIASLISDYFPNRLHLLGTSVEHPDKTLPLSSIDKLTRIGGHPERDVLRRA